MQGRVQSDDADLQFDPGLEHPGGGEIQGVLRGKESSRSADGVKQGEKCPVSTL